MRPRPIVCFILLAATALAGCSGGSDTAQQGDGGVRQLGEEETDLGGLGAVAGRVTDDANRSISGALVVAVGTDQGEVTTGREGTFRFDDLEPGSLRIHVRAEGYQVRGADVTVVADRVVHVEIVLQPLASVGANYRLHAHNYWGGLDTYTLMDESFILTDKPAAEGVNPYLYYAYTGACNANANGTCPGTRWIPLPESEPGHPTIVIPGTGEIEVVLAWDESEIQSDELGLGYIPPDSEDRVLLAPRPNGETWRIPTTPDQADSGHQEWTFWRFFVYFPNDARQPTDWDPVVAVEPELTATIRLHRAEEPFLEPPHPTFWNGSEELTLMDGAMDVNSFSLGSPGGDSIQTAPLPDGSLVPPGTQRMLINFSWDMGDANGLYQHGLKWRTADQNPATTSVDEFQTVEPTPCGDQCLQFDVDVTDETADKFYQTKSGWRFFPYPEPFMAVGMWAELHTQYSATITVFKDPDFDEPGWD